jgi:hypothetical protein
MGKLYEISFSGTDELLKLAREDALLLKKNVGQAITKTTLLGIARIANDCPVDTGRLQASIAGDLAAEAGVDLKSGKIREGKANSTTALNINNLEGRIGTNVEYALYIEYRGSQGTVKKKKPLTDKQRRYLFAVGILKRAKDGTIKLKKRQKSVHGGPGFFRKNIPIIERYFHQQVEAAIKATAEGRLLA